MEYYHICTECGKPTSERTASVVVVNILDEKEKERQFYCPECFKSVTKETIAKNKKKKK